MIKSKSAAAYKGRKFRRSLRFNIDIMDKGNDSDCELGPFFYDVLDKLLKGKYN